MRVDAWKPQHLDRALGLHVAAASAVTGSSSSAPLETDSFSSGSRGASVDFASAVLVSKASASRAGVGRMPMTADGYPDFDAVVAAGGSVQGVIPPDGSSMTQGVDDRGSRLEYAAIVDLGDGTEPFYITGGNVIAWSGASQSERSAMMRSLQQALAELPIDIEKARAQALQYGWKPNVGDGNNPRKEAERPSAPPAPDSRRPASVSRTTDRQDPAFVQLTNAPEFEADEGL